MDVRPIRTEAAYEWALAEITAYFEKEPVPGSPDADRFEVLADLIEAYENRQYPIPELEPIDALKAFMAETGKTQSELAAILGSRSRASEPLNRKRPFTVDMIYRISGAWHLPADLLVRPSSHAA